MAVVVVLAGGGVKSAVAATRAAPGNELCLLHVDHGQRSSQSELDALRELARSLPSAYVWPLSTEMVRQLEQSHPRGVVATRRAGEAGAGEHPSTTTLLARRGLFVTLLAVGLQAAQRLGAAQVVTGLSRHCDAEHLGLAHQEAQSDQAREIIHAMNIVADALSANRAATRIEAPLMDLTYAEIVKLGARLKARVEHTWSCIIKATNPCGECARCKERDLAFRGARLSDPALRAVAR